MTPGGDAAATGDRLKAFTTEAEERWLSGTGPQPVAPAARLPKRAPLMLPSPGAGSWVIVARRARLWVGADGALRLRGPAGPDRMLVPPGRGRIGWWLVDRGPAGAGLPAEPAGWFVISGTRGALLALPLGQWLPGGAEHGADAGLVRATGAEAVCRALGVPFEAIGDPAEARRRVGAVPFGARVELGGATAAGDTMARAVTAGAGLLAFAAVLLLVAGERLAACALAAIALPAPAALDLVAWRSRCRRVRDLPGLLDVWWAAAPAGPVIPGRGLGLRVGPAGQEFVLADGHGGECWLAGPACGGAAGLVAACAGPGRPPWGLLLYDRGEELLAGLRGADWAGGPEARDALADAAGRLGLVVSEVTEPAQPMRSTREGANEHRAKAGPGPALAATRLSLALTAAIALTATFTGPPLARDVFLGWAAAVAAARVLASRRMVR